MLALCVDDEAPLLAELVRSVSASDDITEIVQFRFSSKAFEWAKENKPDIAFLDVQLRGSTGIELADKLKTLYPDLPIIFCTGHKEYAYDAMQLHASGYVLKPVTPDAIQKELDVVVKKGGKTDKLTVNCFGTFDVLKDGKSLSFSRKKSKEVFAYLIDRRGASVTAKEMCAVLWEDSDDFEKNVLYLYKLIADLKNTLTESGFPELFIRQNYNYSINTQQIDCDYYKYLDGDQKAKNKFTGEYMSQYSWAEDTLALLYE